MGIEREDDHVSIERARQLAREILRLKRSPLAQPLVRILDAVTSGNRAGLDPDTAAAVEALYQRPDPTGGERINQMIDSVRDGADPCVVYPMEVESDADRNE
jgi:hypothetical protein